MMACGRCYYDRGMERPIIEIVSRTDPPKRSFYCTFCGEERHPGGHRVRVFQIEGGEETQFNIPHIVNLDEGKPAELRA